MDWGSMVGMILGGGIGSFGGPGTASIGAGIGGSIGSMFDKKKKTDVWDPLAPIRNQLVKLANEYPMEDMKKNISQRYGRRREEGMKDIGEEVYAKRQAPGSIHANLVTDFIERLGESEESDLLKADIAGKEFEMKGLSTALGYAPPEPEDEVGLMEGVLPALGEFAGKQIGMSQYDKLYDKLLSGDIDAEGTVRSGASESKPLLASENEMVTKNNNKYWRPE